MLIDFKNEATGQDWSHPSPSGRRQRGESIKTRRPLSTAENFIQSIEGPWFFRDFFLVCFSWPAR